MEPRKLVKKICLLGDGAVGKTSVMRRYVFDMFDDRYVVSFGTKVVKKVLSVGDAEVNLMIWDILGQKTHSKLHAAFYKGASAALLVCDLTRPETLASIPDWVENFRKVSPDGPLYLLANKSDLETVISQDELSETVSELGIEFIETSAKTGENIEKAFEIISEKIVGDAS